MTTAKKSLGLLAQLAVLYVLAAGVTVFAPNVFLLRSTSTLVLMAFSLALTMVFSEHIIDPETRVCLVASAGLITFWIVLRGAKYIAFEESEAIARHIWYGYYISVLLIPLLSLLAALSVSKRRGKHARAALLAAAGFTAALLALVLTNDAHQLVFRFQPGFIGWDAAYTRGPFFVVIYIWIFCLLLGTFWILFSRCRVSACRRLIWVPILPALFGVTYLTLYALGLWPRINGQLFGEFPEAVCFTLAGVWLSLISIGLIPSNQGYGKLFERSDLAAQIASRDYRVIYRSANAARLTAEQLASDATLSLDRDTRVHRRPVRGGYVYWQDDVTALNRINEELWEVGEHLAEETELVRLENELKQARAQIEAKTRVYDEIAARVLPQSREITALCARAEREPARFGESMKQVCLLAAYIKRYANLSLLAADRGALEAGELYLAVEESLRSVRNLGIPAQAAMAEGGSFPAPGILSAYGLFEVLLEQTLPQLWGIQAVLRSGELRLTIEGGAVSIPGDFAGMLTAEEGVSYVRIPLGKAGEAP